MKGVIVLLCVLMLASCVAGKRNSERSRLYTTYGASLN